MNRQRLKVGDLLRWPALALVFASLLVLARRDRAARSWVPLSIEHRTIRLTDAASLAGGELPPAPAEMREAAAELERAAAAADKARAGLEQTKADLERTKETLERQRGEFEGLRADADANAADTRQQLDQAKDELDARRKELEQASREAEERVAKARKDLEALQHGRLAAAAQAGIAQGLGRGKALDMKVFPDPRRVRHPAMVPFVPNEAAIAAAGPDQRRGAAPGPGQPVAPAAPGESQVPPTVTLAGDVLRGEAENIRAQGEYVVDASRAAINTETARAMSLDNRIRVAEVFFETRRLNRINRALEAGPATTLEQAVRLAARRPPARPSALDLDRSTGDISWPKLLRNPAYAELTTCIQRHFHDRLIGGGSADFENAVACERAFDELAERFRSEAGRHPAGQHAAAGTFLAGLRREFENPLEE